MKKTEFVIDTFPGLKISGFTAGADWNGWACPYFTFEEGQKIADAHKSRGGKTWFDEMKDQFIFEIGGEEEFYSSININDQKLYPIGSESWIWEESE
jgi:hypothetical protein